MAKKKTTRGRPAMKPSERQSARIEIRLNPKEKRELEKAAKAAGVTLSVWVRDKSLEAARVDKS